MLRISGTICISMRDVLCQCIQREREAHIKAHCPPTLSPFAPCHPLRAGVTAHEWGVIPGRICSPAPWSGPALELGRCYYELPGLAKRDGWATLMTAGHRLARCLPWLMSLHSAPCSMGQTGAPSPKNHHTVLRKLHDEKKGGKVKGQTLCKVSRCWKVALWACRVNHRVLCSSSQ